ncbi:RNA polymerase sigma-70 factor (ECF subfamily) [Bradyrhizobium sp. USDA 4524]|uniref:sigma-70 family RNA polymerase sigma factor n=2 Tax=Nitrobacteraceae TaxID=41294 RepID=UPI0020A24C70|nr:sigma-70 family RNA polymerase sigma factor [Bradyrhizobium sp. USDA 4538]MCP1900718.1 RNA polymerase sigma-70 factor (ECF subfamily) [Bradyrhizobium sp. USDA 4537]MCP1993626.1 RNA polymerase sigma-70 factor (ECF subfamily) [Bradyrhizobium sp. USDA 4539]
MSGLRAADPQEWTALMVLGQRGDTNAYHRLLLGITPYLRTIANRAHRNASDAEDTVQDILLTLHEVRHTYDPSRPFKPWLAGIARHRVADRLRALGRVAAGEVMLETEHEAFAAPDQHSELALDGRAVDAALLALPQGQRQAITLLKLQERSLKEAAEQSGMSIASLKVSAHRGIKALRRLLGEGGN